MGQLPAYQAKAEDLCDIDVGQILPHGPTQQQASPRLPQINPGARGGGSGNFFTFGTTRPLGSPTPGEAATVPSDTPLCSVTARDLEGGETLYKTKMHEKIGEIFSAHANQRSMTLDSLRFLLGGQCVYKDQAPSLLNLDGSSKIAFPPREYLRRPGRRTSMGTAGRVFSRQKMRCLRTHCRSLGNSTKRKSKGATSDVDRSSTQSRDYLRENSSCLRLQWP